MAREHRLKVTIPVDHHLSLELPEDFPAEPAEVIVLAEPRLETTLRLAGALAPEAPLPDSERDVVAEATQDLRDDRSARLGRTEAELTSK